MSPPDLARSVPGLSGQRVLYSLPIGAFCPSGGSFSPLFTFPFFFFSVLLSEPGHFFPFYLLIFREGGRERDIHRGKHQLVASRTHPDRGANPQPSHVP